LRRICYVRYYITYENARSITEKARYVAENSLGGTIVWTVNQGYLPNAGEGERDPLMDVLRTEFLNR
jgi:chitinase